MYLSGDMGKETEVRESVIIVNLKLSRIQTEELKFRIVSKKKTSSDF